MFEDIDPNSTKVLNEILKARRTVRAFSGTPLDEKDVELIVKAGLIAPFASIPAKGKTDFRRIFIVPSGSETMKRMISIVDHGMSTFVAEMRGRVDVQSAAGRINGKSGITKLLGNAPYLIIVAERKGYPPTYLADQSISLSYCMYNMWLKAVSLKIGFRLITLFVHGKMGNNEEFCQLLGLPCREFAVDACAIGYPAENFVPPKINYPDYETNVKWLCK